MSSFLNSLEDKLTTMEQKIQALPGELDSIAARLDGGKLRSLLSRLNQNCNELYNKQHAAQMSGLFSLPYIIQATPPYIRPITSEDLSRWREAYKSDVRVVVGKESVGVIAVSELAKKCQTTVPQVVLAAQEQGYTVLDWDEYQKLLDEIGKLISEDERPLPAVVTGIPIMAPGSPQEAKVLPKSTHQLCQSALRQPE